MYQQDYLMAETNLRKSLMLRQKWYGKNHTLVADVLYKLGMLMADESNDKGYKISVLYLEMQCLYLL